MKKKISLFLILILIVGAIFLLVRGTKGEKSKEKEKVLSISQLSRNKGVKCTQILAEGDAGTGKGTIYMYKDMLRFDLTIKHDEAGVKESHVLEKDGKTYVWGSLFAIPGMKNIGFIYNDEEESENIDMIDIEELEKNNFVAPGVTCSAWKPDLQKFEIPSSINFMTEDEAMNPANFLGTNVQGGEPSIFPDVKIDCDICRKMIDESAKKQCLADCEEKEAEENKD